jgi:hypothetical protein
MLKGIISEKNNELYIQYNPKKIYGYVVDHKIERTFYISEIKVTNDEIPNKTIGDTIEFVIIEKGGSKKIKIIE